MRTSSIVAAALAGLLLAGGAGAQEPAKPAPAPVRKAEVRKAEPRKAEAKLPDARLARLFVGLGAAWDPAQRNDFAFTPRPDARAALALANLRRLEVEAEKAGDRATAITARMLVAHMLRLYEEAPAGGLLAAVIAEATSAGWRDGEMRTALHDLAVVKAAAGDAAGAAALETRAAACPRPCATDRPTALWAKGRTLARALSVEESEAVDGERVQAWGVVGPWMRDLLGATSEFDRLFLQAMGDGLEETRPFTAIEIARQQLADATDPEVRAGRLDELHRLLRKAGEYREAAERAEEKAALWASLGREEETLVSRREQAMALHRLGDPSGRARLAEVAPRLVELWDGKGDVASLVDIAADLVALRFDGEADRALAAVVRHGGGLWGAGQYLKGAALAGRARLALRSGRLDEAETLLGQAVEASPETEAAPGLQRMALEFEAAKLAEARGRGDEARRRRAAAEKRAADFESDEPADFQVRAMIQLRDFGAVDAAGLVATIAARRIEAATSARADYPTAQSLWQIAYALALAGRSEAAFATMSRAAAIAVRHSFEAVDDTDGGSLQLMRRDRWRYLLFVDIAWSAAKKRPPEEMTVPSRY